MSLSLESRRFVTVLVKKEHRSNATEFSQELLQEKSHPCMMANPRSSWGRVGFLNLLTFGTGKLFVMKVINHVSCRVLRSVLVYPPMYTVGCLGASYPFPPCTL